MKKLFRGPIAILVIAQLWILEKSLHLLGWLSPAEEWEVRVRVRTIDA